VVRRRPGARVWDVAAVDFGSAALAGPVLYAHVAQAFREDPEVDRVPPVVVDAVRVIAAGALRLAHRALETHASDVGYRHRRLG